MSFNLNGSLIPVRVKTLGDIKGLSMSATIKAQLTRELEQKPTKVVGPNPVNKISKEIQAASMPQEVLTRQLQLDPRTSQYEWALDYSNAVPGRKFEIDCALVTYRCAIEVDGWRNHGSTKEAFNRDREKDYLLSLQGWVVLRIPAGLIHKDVRAASERVVRFLDVWIPRQQAAGVGTNAIQ
ncbi:hypothetical protein [Halomonas sp. KO116]|uniref:hypothetical protein n=1 Tax=Halomonas sp. KO116 TaxID=1504981 RepID=UPI0004E3053D|nr:hypothetical protein [Halomonas sp. KO116]AJY53222.1 hypothetical protein KO116_P200115 [Halomonas sp. KO116]